MKKLLIVLILIGNAAYAQKFTGQDKRAMRRIKADVSFLAADRLEGRRTGTEGERLAYEYIINEMRDIGLSPKGTEANSFLQPFDVHEGKIAKHEITSLSFDEVKLQLNKEFFPLPYSANVSNLTSRLTWKENGQTWLINLSDTLRGAQQNPHFDINDYLYQTAKQSAEQGAAAIIYINTGTIADNIAFNAKDNQQVLKIPVLYVSDKELLDKINVTNGKQVIRVSTDISEKLSTGHNVVGFINNKAKNTIIIGAHYDHLGWGDDKNSLYSGPGRMIHNGADDNASGTAGMLELARWLKKSPLRGYNYLFIAFSGEELGLYGSKYFTKNPTINLTTVNYMINMDMIGRLNPESKGLTIGGYGTSPYWRDVVTTKSAFFNIKLDSSGTGPSDHTSFYRQDIPVLFFFTGTHGDYHKPTDDVEKINFEGEMRVVNYIKDILIASNYESKIAFTKTREVSMGKSSFKVSLGIMPDYTYSGEGVFVDGVSEGKAAQKAGVQKGDVLLQLGSHKFTDVQSYMTVLGKFDRGDKTTLMLRRGETVMELPVQF